MYITLEQAKKHLLVDEDFRADDMYILDLIAVAEDSVSKHLDIALDELEVGGTLPPAIIHAMLLMIGNLYANREPVAFGTVVTQYWHFASHPHWHSVSSEPCALPVRCPPHHPGNCAPVTCCAKTGDTR